MAIYVKEKVEKNMRVKLGFISDDENKIRRMKKYIETKYKYELFTYYGCVTHNLNFLCENIMKKINSVMKHVFEIEQSPTFSNLKAGDFW